MWKDELALIPGVVTLIAPLAGTARYGRHLATHPEPQLDRSIGPVLRRTEDIAAWVAVASRHEDGAAPGFNAKVQRQGSTPRFVAGTVATSTATCAGSRPSVAGIPTTAETARVWWRRRLTASAAGAGVRPIGWVRRPVNEAAPVRTFDETELVNATVCARVNYTSGALRVLALVFLGNICPETTPQRAD